MWQRCRAVILMRFLLTGLTACPQWRMDQALPETGQLTRQLQCRDDVYYRQGISRVSDSGHDQLRRCLA